MIDVPWIPSDINGRALDDWMNSIWAPNTIPGVLVGGDGALSDGSDSSYVDNYKASFVASDRPVSLWTLVPTKPIPTGRILGWTWTVRYHSLNGGGGGPFFRFFGPTGDGIPYNTHELAGQTPATTVTRHLSYEDELNGRLYGLDLSILFAHDSVKVPTVAFLSSFYAGSPAFDFRIYEFGVVVHYEGALPLRQIQRDDHLAPGGTIRASTGTSRQGSIRARGYE